MTQITSHSSKDIASAGVVTQNRLGYFLKVIISPLLAHLSNGCFLFVRRKLSYSSSVERRLNKLAFAIDNAIDNVVISRLY